MTTPVTAAIVIIKPLFIHDCPDCHFLGHGSLGEDIYICLDQEIVVRYSSVPQDYRSRDLVSAALGNTVMPCYKEAIDLLCKGYGEMDTDCVSGIGEGGLE